MNSTFAAWHIRTGSYTSLDLTVIQHTKKSRRFSSEVDDVLMTWTGAFYMFSDVTKGSLSYLSSPCFSEHVLQSGVGIVH